jgi:putative photosynthetic complex assembly protein 2
VSESALGTRLHATQALLRWRRASQVDGVDIATRETPLRVFMRSIFVVVLFWWSATGVIFALERGAATRTVGLVLATLLAVWGLWLVTVERDRVSPSAVRRGFLGASFLWTWVQVLFYGGWLVGPADLAHPIPAEAPSLSLAVRAVIAMLWYQLAMIGVLAVVAWSVARRPNRIAWWALLTFWLSHQAASINIFLGVENPGRGFFPEGTTFLESYFGPQRNSWFLPVTIAVLLVFTLRVAVHALRDGSPMRRQAMMLLTVLGALGVLELAVLGAPINLALWNWFLALRGY